MSVPDSEPNHLIGKVVDGKYRIDQLIGRGGMGAVYRAENTAIGKRVALKFLDRDAARDRDAATRFQREAEAASAVESAHIVQIFDSGVSDDGLPFLVMELLKGEDLRARLRREGRLSASDVVHIAGQVLRALRRAHEAGIVHRDLKPDNVFLCPRDDDAEFVKLVDFGISKVARKATASTLTRRGTVLGTAFYMSPEQAQAFADIDGRSDLYSLGSIMYEALSGRPPHTGTAYEAVLINICTKDAEDVRVHAPDVPAELADVVKKALARDRGERFQSAEEFYDALVAASPGLLSSRGARDAFASFADGSRDSGRRVSSPRTNPDPAFKTAEGAALESRSFQQRNHFRRTLVVGVIAALGAFAVTVVLMARSKSSSLPHQPNPLSRDAPAASNAAASRPPQVTPSAPHSSAEPPLSDAGVVERQVANPKPAQRAASPVGSASSKPSPSGKPTSTAKPVASAGVGSGLQLVTQP